MIVGISVDLTLWLTVELAAPLTPAATGANAAPPVLAHAAATNGSIAVELAVTIPLINNGARKLPAIVMTATIIQAIGEPTAYQMPVPILSCVEDASARSSRP